VWRLAVTGALLAVVTAAYLPLRSASFVNFDDDRLILDNAALRDPSPAGLRDIASRQLFTPHYKPLVYLSWAAELRAFGPDPRAFHRHNLMLHLLNTILVLRLVSLLAAGKLSWRGRIAWAAAVAALWALHPMKVESVAWAAERKDVLFAAFYLGALLSYLHYVDHRRRRWLAVSALLALAGALSKSTAITLPLTLFIVDLIRRRSWNRGLLVEKLPHFAVAAAALYLYGLVPGPGDAGTGLALIASSDPWHRLAAAGHRHLAFAAHWLMPVNLSVLYPVPESLRQLHWSRLVFYATTHMGLLAGLMAARRRDSPAAAALLFYSLTLLPTLVAPISTTNYLSDRYTYLPSLGLAVLAALAGTALWRRWPRFGPALVASTTVALAMLAVLTYRQVAVWRSSERLWNHVLTVQPPHPFAYNNRGVARLARGDADGALADFDRALAASSRYPAALANRADLLRRRGRPQAALRDLDLAVALQPLDGRLHRLRGLSKVELGLLAAGLADYDQALELDPADTEARYLRAQARRRAGDLTGARDDIDRVLQAPDPTADLHILRALIRARQGNLPGALADTTRALDLDPASAVAFNNRGFLRLRLGNPQGALADLDRALALRPRYPLAERNRGDALAALGHQAAACSAWRLAADAGIVTARDRLAACPPASVSQQP
jgi:tetratricopeptide (TPR) repeat protein